MHLAVDLDDCVLDLTGGIRSIVKREYGVEVPEFEAWDLNLVLEPILGRKWMNWFRERDWLWATLPAVEGAIGTLDLLHRDGHYLECVTSKPEWARHSVWKWLSLWRPRFDQVTIVGPDDRKVDFTAADLLVDDKPENVQEFLREGRGGILFDRPHNRHSSLARARGWREVRELVGMLESEPV